MILADLSGHPRFGELAWHVAELLHAAFGSHGLRILEAHRLEPWGREILQGALTRGEALRAALAAGAVALTDADLPVSFDPHDPRPLVLESRDGRRRRIAPEDRAAVGRLHEHPDDFSPHAALRPVVQAAALPVVAQVAGPSELTYLAQARALHAAFGQVPPLLVPRLEATRVPHDLWELAQESPEVDDGAHAAATRLVEAARAFHATVLGLDPALRYRLDRFVERLERNAGRLAEAPARRGHGDRSRAAILRPRGRPQDTVLAWAPDAWANGRPEAWAAHILGLCRPLEAPVHVLHELPEPADG